MTDIYNFSTRINIFTAIKFGKIASSFSLSMSNFWIFYGVLYVSRVAIVLCPFSPMELRHKIFNRSHLNSKLRLGPVFFHSSPFLHFAYTIYLKRIFWYPGAKIQTTFISRYTATFMFTTFINSISWMHSFHKTFVRLHKALVDLNGSNQMKYTENIMNGDHAHIIFIRYL